MTHANDESALIEALQKLPTAHRAMFAAACAERLWTTVADAPPALANALRDALDALWGWLIETATQPSAAEGALDRVMRYSDTLWEDAVAATAYALRCYRTGDAREAAWSARRAYDFLDDRIATELGVRILDRTVAERILGTACIQRELARQWRDIAELRWASSWGVEARVAAEQCRVRAMIDAGDFLPDDAGCLDERSKVDSGEGQ